MLISDVARAFDSATLPLTSLPDQPSLRRTIITEHWRRIRCGPTAGQGLGLLLLEAQARVWSCVINVCAALISSLQPIAYPITTTSLTHHPPCVHIISVALAYLSLNPQPPQTPITQHPSETTSTMSQNTTKDLGRAPSKCVGPDYRSATEKPTATVSTEIPHDNVHILPQTPQLISLLT